MNTADVIVTLPPGVGGGTQIAVIGSPDVDVDVLVRSHPSMAWQPITAVGGTYEIRTRT